MQENSLKVSVIVPVYNANRGGYLSRLIKGVLDQPYQNIELILVDNGSTDGSLDTCLSFAKRDARVVVAVERKRGASAARNKGLSIASGDYVHMCDADDLLENDIYHESMKFAELYEPDVIRFNLATYHEDSFISNTIIQQPYEVLLDRQYIIDEVVPYTIGIKVQPDKKIDSHLTLITKRKIIEDNHIRYNENQTKEEDHPFLVNILAYTQSMIFLRGTYYHYMKHSGSLISTYSPRFKNFCNNFALYENLFGSYYDFKAPTKVEYNINAAIDAMEYVIYHHKDCNCKKEIKDILDSQEIKQWVQLLKPQNEMQLMLKDCVESHNHTKFFYYLLWHVFRIRLNNLLRRLKRIQR